MKHIIELVEYQCKELSDHDRGISGFVLDMDSNGSWCWDARRCSIKEIEDYIESGKVTDELADFKDRLENKLSTIFVLPTSGSGVPVGYLRAQDDIEYIEFESPRDIDSFAMRDMTYGNLVDFNKE